MSIGQGLTLIRKYDFVKHAYGSQAFFMLSIGIERLLKLIYIYNHRREFNNRFPDNGKLRKFGHVIRSQYQVAREIADNLNLGELYQNLDNDPIINLIIDFLTDFAGAARYYNLDTLTGGQNLFDEPLRRWDTEINSIIVERHYKRNLKKKSR